MFQVCFEINSPPRLMHTNVMGMLIGKERIPNSVPLLFEVSTNAEGNEKVEERQSDETNKRIINRTIGNVIKLSNDEWNIILDNRNITPPIKMTIQL